MATTHGLVGAGLVVLALPGLPDEVAAPLVVAAFAGGLLPDLDVVATHRRTLHYPVGFSLLAVLAGVVAATTGSTAALVLTAAVGSAAVHALSDVFGGSPEDEPWNPSREIAVYDHVNRRWYRARRWVRYSGAPEDFLLAAIAGSVAVLSPATGPVLDAALCGVIAVTGLFALARKHLDVLAGVALALVPPRLRRLLPRLRVEGDDGDPSTLAIRFER